MIQNTYDKVSKEQLSELEEHRSFELCKERLLILTRKYKGAYVGKFFFIYHANGGVYYYLVTEEDPNSPNSYICVLLEGISSTITKSVGLNLTLTQCALDVLIAPVREYGAPFLDEHHKRFITNDYQNGAIVVYKKEAADLRSATKYFCYEYDSDFYCLYSDQSFYAKFFLKNTIHNICIVLDGEIDFEEFTTKLLDKKRLHNAIMSSFDKHLLYDTEEDITLEYFIKGVKRTYEEIDSLSNEIVSYQVRMGFKNIDVGTASFNKKNSFLSFSDVLAFFPTLPDQTKLSRNLLSKKLYEFLETR